jgi:hypothetical protein
MTAHEAAREAAHDDEHAGEHTPYDTSYAHVTNPVEDWWTGTD